MDLEYLLMSEWIRKVHNGEMTPKDLDTKISSLQKEVRELKHLRQLDMAQIVEQRRQIAFLMEGN